GRLVTQGPVLLRRQGRRLPAAAAVDEGPEPLHEPVGVIPREVVPRRGLAGRRPHFLGPPSVPPALPLVFQGLARPVRHNMRRTADERAPRAAQRDQPDETESQPAPHSLAFPGIGGNDRPRAVLPRGVLAQLARSLEGEGLNNLAPTVKGV